MDLLKKLKFYLDKKLVLLVIGFYAVFSVFALVKMVYFKSIGERFTNNTWSYMFLGVYLVDFLLVIFFMSITLIITKYMVVKKLKWIQIILVHITLSVFLGIFIFYGILSIQKLFGLADAINMRLDTIIYYYMNVIDLNFLIYFSLVGIIHTYYYFQISNLDKLTKIKLKNKFETAKARMLQTQLQPHFLFNSLNNITALIDIDKERSKNMIADLSNFLIRTLEIKNAEFITLSKELEILNMYINIVQNRFHENLKIEKKVDENTFYFFVPPLILQPIIENIIKHSYSIKHEEILIEITIREETNTALFIQIKNNGQLLNKPLEELLNTGFGLANIKDRLDISFKNQYTFKLFNDLENKKVILNLILPKVLSVSLKDIRI